MTYFILCTPAEAVPATRAEASSALPFMIAEMVLGEGNGMWWWRVMVRVVVGNNHEELGTIATVACRSSRRERCSRIGHGAASR